MKAKESILINKMLLPWRMSILWWGWHDMSFGPSKKIVVPHSFARQIGPVEIRKVW